VSSFDELRAMLERLGGLAEATAKEAAPLVDEAIKETVAGGQAPDGTPWAAKKGGGRALVHAADRIQTRAFGTVVRTTLTGVEIFHNFGAGVPRRQILPDPGTVPPKVEAALRKAAARAFEKLTR
jgi:hypothetical protein